MSAAVSAPEGLVTASPVPAPDISGLLNINKPQGITSFRVVKEVRRLLGVKKVGHCGTLDPMASGVLLVVFGRSATRQVPLLMQGAKTYRAEIRLGLRTDTGDATGKVLEQLPVPEISREKIESVLREFTGTIEQIPPMFSALKHRGKKLYEYARRGVAIKRAPRKIEIYSLVLIRESIAEDRTLEIRAVCSKGTYVRTLAEDIGRRLGTVATLSALVREAVGPYKIEDSFPGESLPGARREALLHKAQDPGSRR